MFCCKQKRGYKMRIGGWSSGGCSSDLRVQAPVALADAAERDRAVASAVEGQRTWAQVNPQRRARVLFEFKRLLERDMAALAWLLSAEHGKVLSDARGDLQRGLEVIEFS